MLPSPSEAAQEANERVAYEVADVVRAYGAQFVRTHPSSAQQRRVLRAIASCRTAVLGGHVEACDGCGHHRIAYNSCRNRHCPKCQGKERAKWMAAEHAMLLPVGYFHVVFTLPHALNPLIRANRTLVLGLLFRLAARTLRTFALDPHHLGAEPAITMVLHSWGQTLDEHYHIHCVISGGGLSADGRTWVSLPAGKKKRRKPFLFPVRALSRAFRTKFVAALGRARRNGKLNYVGQSAALVEAAAWKMLTEELGEKDWVVYSKPPFGGPEQVLKYLSGYTHRVAISNRRILFVGDGMVRLEYRDYGDYNKRKELTLAAAEFLRRFLQHVLPKGFMRIRHYGITANCGRKEKLARSRELLGQSSPAPRPERHPIEWETPTAETESAQLASRRCPACGAPMRVIEIIPPTPLAYDTS